MIASDWAGSFRRSGAPPNGMGGFDPAPPGPNDDDVPFLLLNGDAKLHVGSDGPVDEEAFLAEVPDIIPSMCWPGSTSFGDGIGSRRMAESKQARRPQTPMIGHGRRR